MYIQWQVTESQAFEVEAETEDEAEQKAIDHDEVGEDYQIDKVVDLGEVEVKEPIYIDPNQMSLL